ncbi:MAG: outer membrane protein assembly factor BamA, partial [Deltaproteobacteria bacterium]|nr:outer membrane protein assembly factor BamA [Deltaproteobacteria bacterium]
VFINGNKEVSAADLSDILKFDAKRFVDKHAINGLIKKAVLYYQTQGFYDAAFDYSVVVSGEGQVDITFNVQEGARYRIRKVEIAGADKADTEEMLDGIQTKRYKWWSSWLFGTGRVNQDLLQNDKLILQQYLLDHGFIESRVSDATVEKVPDGLKVAFSMVEGPRYNFGKLSASGDLINNSVNETLEGIKSKSNEVFSASLLREDTFLISDKFGDQGYAFANVVPDTSVNRESSSVDVNFKVSKGDVVTVERINIKGNQKTYDNVIRRQLKLAERETYSSSKIKRSRALLERTGYFEEVNISQEPGSAADRINLDVNVREGSTGAFSVGAGYSTGDGFIVNTQVSENNFFGTGRQLMLNIDLGSERENFVLSFEDPRFQDSYWSLGADLFLTEREFIDFDRQMMGGSATLGYPLEELGAGAWAEDIHFSVKYEYADIKIDDVDPQNAAQLVIDSEGRSTSSGFTPRLVRNTINNPMNPVSGSRQSLSLELTGAGGDQKYWLAEFANTWYYPLWSPSWGDFVFSWRIKFGYGKTYNDDPFPLFRRYFPGGINSVRGYEDRSLGPRDDRDHPYGGSKQVINNLELLFPLINSAGIKGVLFYDAGQAYDDDEDIDFDKLRYGYGVGIRWMSPLGPIRLEFGFPTDREPGEDAMVTMFSFGAPL